MVVSFQFAVVSYFKMFSFSDGVEERWRILGLFGICGGFYVTKMHTFKIYSKKIQLDPKINQE